MKRFEQRARELRASQTKPEATLWRALRGRQLESWKFRRQHPIDRYVVDFVSLDAKLVIEIDGDTHFSEAEIVRDAERTQVLEGLGFHVIRFTNLDVRENLEGVLDVIRSVLARF